jgi:hypothetical protein
MSGSGHPRPSHFVPVLNNVRYASDSDHSRYESELTLWACVDGSELARTFFTNAALVGAAMCSACPRRDQALISRGQL